MRWARAVWSPPNSFQSTPSTEAGRCLTALQQHMAETGFNPRPALRLGDAFPHPMTPIIDPFQSTPSTEAGRCAMQAHSQ